MWLLLWVTFYYCVGKEYNLRVSAAALDVGEIITQSPQTYISARIIDSTIDI